jgi:DNA-binding NarL/FixJ family response regulator
MVPRAIMPTAASCSTSRTPVQGPEPASARAGDVDARRREPPGDITVLVVDDHPGFRRAIKRALLRAPGVTLVGSAGDGEEALSVSARLRPRVVVMDLAMPGVSGVEATRRLMSLPEPPAVVALSGSRELMRDAIAAGACGALLKEADLTELLSAIRVAAHG